MMSAAMTPGTHPQRESRNTISTEPHPRSTTANGGKIIAKSTRRQDMIPFIVFCGAKLQKKSHPCKFQVRFFCFAYLA